MRTRIIGTATGLILMALAAGLPSTAAAQPTTQTTQRYIVQTDSTAVTNDVAVRVRKTGGQVGKVYTKVLSGFSATLTTQQVSTLRKNSAVASITPDVVFHTTTVERQPTWGLDRIDQRTTRGDDTYTYSSTGAGVTAFVIDTGVRLTQTQFGQRAVSGYDFADRDADASDCDGHGTHVAGTIAGSTYGVAKGVKIVSVRALDCAGSGWVSDIIDSLDWVTAHKPSGPAVVNMSISGPAYAALDRAVERTVAAGITVVVAAGNTGDNACDYSPSRAPGAITVAATDSTDTRPSWSNYGSCVDLFAPGVEVLSASNASDTATEIMSGTSMATPHVVGLVARYLQAHPTSTPAQTTAALVSAATTNAVQDAQGSPNRLAYASPATTFVPTKVTTRRS